MTPAPAQPSSHPKSTPIPAGKPLHRRVRLAGWIGLFVGLTASAVLYVTAPEAADLTEAAFGRRDDYAIERFGGTFGVQIAHFRAWLGTLMHGRPLAITIAVLTVAVALACRWFADLVDDTPHHPQAPSAD